MNTKNLVLTALAVTVLSSGSVFAKDNGNGNGNNGNGNGNGNGAVASELKWRNAAHASAQAFLNASPNSAVGKLATLRDARVATAEAYEATGIAPGTELRDPLVIQAEIDGLVAPTRTSEEVQAEIDLALAVEPPLDVTALQTELAAAKAYEGLVAELEATNLLNVVLAAEAEAGAVVGVGELSVGALEALWGMLDSK